jgi:formylglycine-generating enzyme required for sulfatase activity
MNKERDMDESLNAGGTLVPQGGKATPSGALIQIGSLVGGRYVIVDTLGRGGMGEVYVGRDERLGREVALKVLRPDLIADSSLLERFRREARAVAQLAHPRIVTLHDFDADASTTYIVMERLHGVDLAQHVRAHGPLSSTEVRRIALQVLDALEYAHARQVVHRDIKPSNLYLQENGEVKVLDFGLARSAGDHTMSMVGAGLGTADYVAPEQAEDATKADARSDQFSLGATLYFTLTGKSPRVIRERDIPASWRDLVLQMLEQAPSQRYATLAEVRATLQALSFGDNTPVVRPTVAAAPLPAPAVQPAPVTIGDVSSWAEVLKASVDRSIVTDARLANQITAVGLPWRVRDRVTGIEMVLIPPGSYMRGASPDDKEADGDERPAHHVTITRAFYLGVCPVTQSEWSKLMRNNPSHFKGDRHPVEQVSWADIQSFLWKSVGFRLPTEGEWEYACRAGLTSACYGELSYIAWSKDNSSEKTHPVGSKRANAFGLHDMLGNVYEWCSDWYVEYPVTPQVDPEGPNSGVSRVLRGGSWDFNRRHCRASFRNNRTPIYKDNDVGFRVARTP